MTTLEIQLKQIIVTAEGLVRVYLNGCAVDTTPVIIDEFFLNIQSTDDAHDKLQTAENQLKEVGYPGIPSDIIDRVKLHKVNTDTFTSIPSQTGVYQETCLLQCEINPDGQMTAWFTKCTKKDGEMVGKPKIHGIPISPVTVIDDWTRMIGKNIVAQGYGEISPFSLNQLKTICAVEHTPECCAKYRVDKGERLLREYRKDAQTPKTVALITEMTARLKKAQDELDILVVTP